MKQKSNYIVEKHFIKRTHLAWGECDSLCFKAKNLYNQALYRIRQYFFKTGKFKNYSIIQKELQNEKADCYIQMKSKISQLILQHVNQDFINFFASFRAWKKDSSKFLGRPNIPHYKDKDGRCSVSFNTQSMSKSTFNKGILQLSSLFLSLKLQHPIKTITKNRKIKNSIETKEYKTSSLKEVSIIPYNNGYLIIVKHEISDYKSKELNGLVGGGDPGVSNLMAVSTNVKKTVNFIINGRPLKSINQYYNKKFAELKSELDTCSTRSGKKKIKAKINKLCRKRNHKIEDYLHKASRILVNRLASIGVTHFIIGKNIEWKQEVNMCKKNNQNFVQIPHDKFIGMIKYKWEALGFKFSISEESYSSKCSFLDNESLEHHNKYLGRRVKRGLFKSYDGYFLNADINGAANIVRKVVKNAWDEWSHEDLIEGFVVSPVNLTVLQPRKKLKQAA